MTEPGAGSDLQGIRTSAVDAGDHYVLNGQKTFISNGILADLVIVVARTDPDAGHQGISLLVVERGMEGFERGRNLDKIGQHAQDTAELFFDDVARPEGEPPRRGGLRLRPPDDQPRRRSGCRSPPRPRTACEAILDDDAGLREGPHGVRRARSGSSSTTASCSPRWPPTPTSPGSSSTTASRATCAASSTPTTASMAKWWLTELQKKIVDQAVQLHGGYGYMTEYPIARAYVNSRVQTIYGGTTEIQKEIIGRSLGL